MSYENKIYPIEETGRKPLYYVEFERGNHKGEFTLFRRQFMYSEAELEEMKTKTPLDLPLFNEVHPWNIFTATYGADGTVPDRKWVEWMVDALNLKIEREEMESGDFS